MPEFLQASLEVLIGIALLFGGGELFVQGAVALAVIRPSYLTDLPDFLPFRIQSTQRSLSTQ